MSTSAFPSASTESGSSAPAAVDAAAPELPGFLDRALADLVGTLFAHPLYGELRDGPRLCAFLRTHAFCVWDFQSLLKALQRAATCVEVPWVPTADPEARRLVNAIVLDEESDATPDGRHLSHYELYLEAMDAAGADTGPVRGVVAEVARGVAPERALARADVPRGAAEFVTATLRVAREGAPHEVAAAFAWGREEVIPGMFRRVVAGLAAADPVRWSAFRGYLERHVGCDADEHGPAARALVARLVGTDPERRRGALAAARGALEARLALWDAVLADVRAAAGAR